MQFTRKTVWNEIKVDLKNLFKEIGIKYQYSEKSPFFRVSYGSTNIKVEISWLQEILHIKLEAKLIVIGVDK